MNLNTNHSIHSHFLDVKGSHTQLDFANVVEHFVNLSGTAQSVCDLSIYSGLARGFNFIVSQ